MEIKKNVKADFRIVIYDLKKNISRTISLSDHHDASAGILKQMIEHCIQKGEYKQFVTTGRSQDKS